MFFPRIGSDIPCDAATPQSCFSPSLELDGSQIFMTCVSWGKTSGKAWREATSERVWITEEQTGGTFCSPSGTSSLDQIPTL